MIWTIAAPESDRAGYRSGILRVSQHPPCSVQIISAWAALPTSTIIALAITIDRMVRLSLSLRKCRVTGTYEGRLLRYTFSTQSSAGNAAGLRGSSAFRRPMSRLRSGSNLTGAAMGVLAVRLTEASAPAPPPPLKVARHNGV
jgi:hypothetical protein